MAAPATMPEQFGRYRILKKIGAGGMGAVYLAEDTLLGRRVAVKVPHFDENDGPQVVERFLREARTAAGIDHPNLCQVFDVGVVDGVHYFTMPFIEGQPLSKMIHGDSPWAPRRAAELVRQLALALGTLHGRGIIHRDLKPGNIMLRGSGEPVLMDFGLARSYEADTKRLTVIGSALGTPAYMSPEQVSAVPDLGPAADIYSLGVILYELLTGRLPFEGPPMAVFAQVLNATPVPPRQLRPDLDPAIDAVCRKAMAKKVGDRHPSMQALAADLGQYLQAGAAPMPVALSLEPTIEQPPRATPKKPPSAETPPPTVPAAEAEIRVNCPGCKRVLRVSPAMAGKKARCPNCKMSMTLPAPQVDTLPVNVAKTVPNKNRNEPDGEAEGVGPPKDRRLLIGLAVGGGALVLLVLILVLAGGSGGKGDDKKPAGAALELKLPEEVELEVGEWTTVKVSVRRTNCKGPIALKPVGLSADGFETRNNAIGPDESSGQFELLAKPGVEMAPVEVEVEAIANDAKGKATLRLFPQPKLPREFTNSFGMKFVLIRRGKFQMGTPADQEAALPNEHLHEVAITQPFYMAIHEVTQKVYHGITSGNPSHFSAGGGGANEVLGLDTSDFPVEMVTHDDAVKFCQNLSKQAKEQENNREYRLATEAEWEYAARGKVHAMEPFSFGGKISSTEANFDGSLVRPLHPVKGPFLKRTAKVGSYKPNDLGLCDMHGNVAEWCQDWYGDYPKEAVKDPQGPAKGDRRVVRGGSWEDLGESCRSAARFSRLPGEALRRIGIRVVCPVPAVKPGN